ncbi:MAG: tryptophan--tRNA ligase [Bacteroidetes bacterium]|nr:tryptophan--tRNA ligase [Bacteroidota bacterium]
MEKKILVSGVKPTGQIHIGNYFGALKQFVDTANSGEYLTHVFLADYHALTSVNDKEKLQKLSFDLICTYLAIGLDPKRVVLYRQSTLPEHAELTWMFNCLVTIPWLERAHAYKDAQAKKSDINVGTFDYPVLMAADILMYDADIVPVGKDQVQHIEMAREIANKFNNTYGETFKMPKELLVKEVEVVPGTDGQKMSKSYNNVIPLFGTDAEIEKAIMGIVTDSKAPEEKKVAEENNIYKIYKLIATAEECEEMRKGFEEGGLGYGSAKKMLLEKFTAYFSSMRKAYDKYQQNPKKVYAILKRGEKKMRKLAERKMETVRKLTGLRP